jgi:hypothetical protein
MRRLAFVAVALALVAAACGDEPATTTSTTGATTTTIESPRGVPSEIAELIEAAERVRGLSFIGTPQISVVSDDELVRRVHALIEDSLDPDDLAVWQTLYELLGLIDPTIDLAAAYRDLYAEQVGGFYDSDTGEMVVGAGSSLSPLARSTIVHELVHALTDQHFGYAGVFDDLVDRGLLDEALALQALVEGDATYFQLVYLQGLPLADQIAAVEESLATDTSVLDSLPAWFGEDLTFPYDAGFRFVTRLIDVGGVAQVNQAYELPPQTTEQILHPEIYLARLPARPVTMPEAELPGYEVFEEGTFGEWNLQLLLLDGVAASDKPVAAAGWGGDRYRIYWDGARVAFAYVYEADTPRDAEELAQALVRATAATMGLGGGVSAEDGVTTFATGSGFAQVRAGERRVVFVAANDPGTGSALAAALAVFVADESAG